jgi:hypothetical protein
MEILAPRYGLGRPLAEWVSFFDLPVRCGVLGGWSLWRELRFLTSAGLPPALALMRLYSSILLIVVAGITQRRLQCVSGPLCA